MMSPSANTEDIQRRIEQEYRHLDTLYFNSAYFGPSPFSAKEAVSYALQTELDPSFYDHNIWLSIPEKVRIQIAELLGVSPDGITHSTSTSDIVAIIANGYPLNRGDVVCSIDLEFPSNILPWMRAAETRGIDFRALKLGSQPILTVDWLDEHLPPKTKIFNVSHVAFDTGKRIDLVPMGRYLRERGIFFIVDSTQAFGGLAIAPKEMEVIDVLACSSYKWLLGPYGHAFGRFSPEAVEKIEHRSGSWTVTPKFNDMAALLDYTTDTLPGARKYDRGQGANMLAMSCLKASLHFLSSIGLDYIEKHNADLRNHFLEHYPRKKYALVTPTAHMGNIVCLKSEGIDPDSLQNALMGHNIDVSIRAGNIRLSFHIFNTMSQVEELIEVLDSV